MLQLVTCLKQHASSVLRRGGLVVLFQMFLYHYSCCLLPLAVMMRAKQICNPTASGLSIPVPKHLSVMPFLDCYVLSSHFTATLIGLSG